jgi:Ca2+-binding RTX toxin-like protein
MAIYSGTTNNDSLTGSDSDDSLSGGDGNDSLYGGKGRDTLIGGNGNDYLEVGDAGDYLDGGAGNDVLVTTFGLGWNPTLIGGDGVDVLWLSAGAIVYVDMANGTVSAYDMTESAIGIEQYRPKGFTSLWMTGTTGGDQLQGGSETDSLVGAGGEDTLLGWGGDDYLVGGAAADSLEGGDGNDSLTTKEGDDRLNGGSGNDQLYAGTGNDALNGGSGNDTLDGNIGSDGLSGGDGSDALYGGDGADLLSGDAGADMLSGGAGNDTLSPGSDADAVYGGTGIDVVTYAASQAGFSWSLTQVSGSGWGADTLSGIERLQFSDANVALDLTGNAGMVARVLGASFGADSVTNPAMVGVGLDYADTGLTEVALMQLALQAALGSNPTNDAVVTLLATNLAGVPLPADLHAHYVGLLTAGTYTQAALAVLAAGMQMNMDNIEFASLQVTGLPYA